MPAFPNRLLPLLAIVLVAGFAVDQPANAASTSRVSVATGGTQAIGGTSWEGTISANGRFVAFRSGATNLVAGDNNARDDIFVHDRQTGVTQRVSVVTGTGAQANGHSREPAISADGRFVVFTSDANNLVADDTNIRSDIFLRDRQTGVTERISVDSAGVQSNGTNSAASVSPNGLFVSFLSEGNNLLGAGVDTNSRDDVFVRDRVNGTTVRVSVGSGGVQANDDSSLSSISADGNLVAFASRATNLVADDTNTVGDIFVHNRQSQTTVRVSVDSAGNQATGSAAWDESSFDPSITPDGRFVVFTSASAGLVADDNNANQDIFVHDRQTAATVRVNLTSAGAQVTDRYSDRPAISPDGRFVVFRSASAQLIPNDTNGKIDVFLRDRVGGTTERVNIGLGGGHLIADSFYPSLSGDARFITFDTVSTGAVPVDTNGFSDVFVRDRGPFGPNDLLIDFATRGLYQRMNNATWVKVHASNPLAIAAGDLDGNFKDEAIASFSGLGLYARYNNAAPWVRLHATAAARLVTGDLDNNGRDEIVAAFGASGIFARYNNAGAFVRLHTSTSQGLAVGDFDGNGKDDLLADLSTGLWVRRNNVNPWVRLHATSPTVIATGDLDGNGKDEVIGFFPRLGVLARYNNAGAWVRLHTLTAQGLATGDFDGNGKDDLVADFGASGLYVRYNNAGGWVKRHASNPVRIVTADLDRNGKDEVIASFAGTGIFARRNNVDPWVRLHTWAEQGMAAGGFD